MGDHHVSHTISSDTRARYIRHLMDDIKALDQMVTNDLIEKDITRIGAEQEFCLITENFRPAKNGQEILESIQDPHFTTELAKFNLELNLDPVVVGRDCFSIVEQNLKTLMAKAAKVAAQFDTKILLAGILPTISKNELHLDYMTQNPRYWALNEMIKNLKGSDFELHIMGVDELSIHHDSVLFEACNTSFQMHLQISPDDFIPSYNWAQAISGPVLGISANSPLLLGRDLWSETRIALFQQSIDTRKSSYALKDQQARVTFGNNWATGGIADIFRDDIANFNVILEKEIDENSLEALAAGRLPKLQALAMNNSTIYRWNRACFGSTGEKAHVRIENRYIPSGPSIEDEMAVFALWVGLMKGRPEKFKDMSSEMDFREAKSNFIKSARNGKESVMNWMGELMSVRDLVMKELLPIAQSGLETINVNPADISRLLGIIERRAVGKTGAQWQISNYRNLRKTVKQDDALLRITEAMYKNQQDQNTVDKWPMIDSNQPTNRNANEVRHIMTTQILSVRENDLASLASAIMNWKDIHHVPVENQNGLLVGLLTWTHLQKKDKKGMLHDDSLVKEVMTNEVVFVRPETKIAKAISMMKRLEFGSLPVVSNGHIVGLITIKDVLEFDKE